MARVGAAITTGKSDISRVSEAITTGKSDISRVSEVISEETCGGKQGYRYTGTKLK